MDQKIPFTSYDFLGVPERRIPADLRARRACRNRSPSPLYQARLFASDTGISLGKMSARE